MIFFPYGLVTVNDCLSDTLKKAKSAANSSLQNIRKDNLNKLIFAHLDINSIRNKYDSLADIIKDNIDILTGWPVFLRLVWKTNSTKSK